MLVVWRPDLHSYTAHITKEVNITGPASSKMNNADLPKIVGQGLGKLIQLWQEDVHVRLGLPTVTSCDIVADLWGVLARPLDCMWLGIDYAVIALKLHPPGLQPASSCQHMACVAVLQSSDVCTAGTKLTA